MFASFVAYLGLLIAMAGVVFAIRPSKRFRVPTRRRAVGVIAGGILATTLALVFPATDASPAVRRSRIDEFVPVWQFDEFHTLKIAAPPERVFAAIRAVRADEIFLFRFLTWIRRGGRALPETILDAGDREPLIDVALKGGFVKLADDPPRELVIGAAVVVPPGARGKLTPETFRRQLAPGFALAAMNFIVTPDGANGSIVTTETRVAANSPASRRQFAAYWRLIYPGSALIRRSWLRAVAKRATSSQVE